MTLESFICNSLLEYVKSVDWNEIDKIDERELWDAQDSYWDSEREDDSDYYLD